MQQLLPKSSSFSQRCQSYWIQDPYKLTPKEIQKIDFILQDKTIPTYNSSLLIDIGEPLEILLKKCNDKYISGKEISLLRDF
ncbi:MAG: hypothetical protein C0432_00445 [Candidatus Puniceispirillum sp.]|nr:hypothetical protein [Candidatus Pelagibacter sp.]MBA4282752.1 hypothetical protein [Candidatus Puniceispirillum sp.]